MSNLTFDFKPSPETNDHEVLVLVDGEAVIGKGRIGIDPPEFFAQFSNASAGRLLIGRCECGVVGCDDEVVAVEITETHVIWRSQKEYRFGRPAYEDAVRRASLDLTWEDANRRAERLTNEILRGCQTRDGFKFQWASARIEPMVMKLSFLKGVHQVLRQFAWDGSTDKSAIQGATRFRDQLEEL